MLKVWPLPKSAPISLVVMLLALLGWTAIAGAGPAAAQEDGAVQELTGRIEAGEVVFYLLPDLQAGQRLSVYATTASGNLDPIVGLVEAAVDPETLEKQLESTLDQALAEESDPLLALEAVRDEFALVWDDDGGGGLSAAFEYEIPADGAYRLLVAGALSMLGGQTFGDYRLQIGLDAPQVLTGSGAPTDTVLAVLDTDATPPDVGAQEITGAFTAERAATFFELNDMKAGDTLYVTIQATSGDLKPSLVLKNFTDKPLRSDNLTGSNAQASLTYTFPVAARNHRLEIAACCAENPSAGDYILLVGVNTPELLEGVVESGGRTVVREPIEVQVGVRLEQIVDVDQEREFFTAVASARMEWTDPALAFNPETCDCDFITLTGTSFNNFLAETNANWPDFSFQNQQGNRWTQNKDVVIFSDGHVIFFERFTTDFQVDFDFRQFPFDRETFYIRVDSIFPEEYYVYSELEGFSSISTEHGEDEFILTNFETGVTTEQSTSGAFFSRFTFQFDAPRHLNYYVFFIFVPIILIILVSWITFFLKDYTRRIEVASANLLLFIAFSFSLSDNYPRLGYLTFLDGIMVVMFVINALVVIYNVWLKRMEMAGQGELADRIDSVLDWVYPLVYLGALGFLIWWFV